MARANGMRSTMRRRAHKTALNCIAFGNRVHAADGRWPTIFAVLIAAILLLVCALPAAASETITYSYDALGRLVKVVHSGTVNTNTSGCYTYDGADNRTNVTVSTASDCSGSGSSVSFSVDDPSIPEGGVLVFTVTKNGTASGTTTVDFATASGTATAGSDYTAPTPGTLTFLSGDTTKTVSVQTTDDALTESNETVFLNLTNPTGGATISDNQGVGTIVDNDGPSSISIGNKSVTEGGNLSFTVTRSGSTAGAVSVDYATADGTATAGSDYTAGTGTVTFAAGETTKTITVATIDDSLQESDETVLVNLSNATGGATISGAQGVGTIKDNDTPLTLAIGDASAIEGQTLTFTITVNGPHPTPFTVDYATADGTATSAGHDYGAQSRTLTIQPSNTTATINIPSTPDQLVEGNETFTVNLSNATGGATITDAQGVGTIIDDD
jgi:hypothetical protein